MALSRATKVADLAKHIYEHVICPQEETIATTGALTPSRSLRHRATRDLLRWAASLPQGRWFTQGMVKAALDKISKEQDLRLPEVPGFSMPNWVAGEATELHKLLKRAKKLAPELPPESEEEEEKPKQPAPMDPDNAETLPWPQLDPEEDSMFCEKGFSPASSFSIDPSLQDSQVPLVKKRSSDAVPWYGRLIEILVHVWDSILWTHIHT